MMLTPSNHAAATHRVAERMRFSSEQWERKAGLWREPDTRPGVAILDSEAVRGKRLFVARLRETWYK
jgi:hypothetical protein